MPVDLLGELGLREGADLEALDDRAALLLGQERAQRVLAVQLVAAVGADQEQALVAQAAHQGGEELERRAIGPVEVLDGEAGRALRGQPVEQRAQQPEEAGLGDASPVAVMPSPGSSAVWVALSSGSSRARSPPAGPTSSAKAAGSSSRASPRSAAAIGA